MDFEAQVEAVKTEMDAGGLRYTVSDLQRWPMVVRQLEPFAKRGDFKKMQEIRDFYRRLE